MRYVSNLFIGAILGIVGFVYVLFRVPLIRETLKQLVIDKISDVLYYDSNDTVSFRVSSYQEGQRVKESLFVLRDEAGVTFLYQLYTLLGIEYSFSDTNYGWYDLEEARIFRDYHKKEWIIRLPKPTFIAREYETSQPERNVGGKIKEN